jgi:hypothetical protein
MTPMENKNDDMSEAETAPEKVRAEQMQATESGNKEIPGIGTRRRKAEEANIEAMKPHTEDVPKSEPASDSKEGRTKKR